MLGGGRCGKVTQMVGRWQGGCVFDNARLGGRIWANTLKLSVCSSVTGAPCKTVVGSGAGTWWVQSNGMEWQEGCMFANTRSGSGVWVKNPKPSTCSSILGSGHPPLHGSRWRGWSGYSGEVVAAHIVTPLLPLLLLPLLAPPSMPPAMGSPAHWGVICLQLVWCCGQLGHDLKPVSHLVICSDSENSTQMHIHNRTKYNTIASLYSMMCQSLWAFSYHLPQVVPDQLA